MMLAVPLISLLALTGGTSGEPTSEAQAAAKRFRQVQWLTVDHLREVPEPIVDELRSRFGRDSRIADRGEPFSATDVGSDRPSRRLLVAAHSDPLWFVCYEAGGIGHHIVLVMFELERDVAKLVFVAQGFTGTHDDLKGWKVEVSELQAELGTWRLELVDPALYLPKRTDAR